MRFTDATLIPDHLAIVGIAEKAVQLARVAVETHRPHDDQHHHAFQGGVGRLASFWKQPIEREHQRRPPVARTSLSALPLDAWAMGGGVMAGGRQRRPRLSRDDERRLLTPHDDGSTSGRPPALAGSSAGLPPPGSAPSEPRLVVRVDLGVVPAAGDGHVRQAPIDERSPPRSVSTCTSTRSAVCPWLLWLVTA